MHRLSDWSDLALDQILLKKDMITQEQINTIERMRAIEGGGWATHVVDAGFVNENELLQIILEDTKLPYFPILNFKPEPDILSQFTRDFMHSFECFPLDCLGSVYTIVTTNPYQKELLETRGSFNQVVEIFVCRVSEWREFINQFELV